MTKARMDELQFLLVKYNWEVKGHKNAGLYDIYDDTIIWDLFNEQLWKKRKLIFYLFEDFGNRATKLSEISFVESDNNIRLFFNKINSVEWNQDLIGFVKKLNNNN